MVDFFKKSIRERFIIESEEERRGGGGAQ